jgi:uncharacterized protein YutE (UPF0331/DUF86 family)
MLDKERILSKIDDMNSYLNELRQIVPESFSDYLRIEKKRSCERLLQLCIECSIDICKLFVSGLKLGLPYEENDLFDKMQKRKLLSKEMVSLLKEMRAFRNILIHEYAHVDDELAYEKAKTRLEDFEAFKNEIVTLLKNQS